MDLYKFLAHSKISINVGCYSPSPHAKLRVPGDHMPSTSLWSAC